MEKPPSKKAGRKPGTSAPRVPPGQIPQREAKLLENRFLKGQTLADAALGAGYQASTRSSAKAMASAVVARHRDPNGELIRAMNTAGIDAELLANTLAAGLRATTTIKSGSEVVEVVDYGARHKYLESCIDILGSRAPKKIEIESMTFEQRLLQITIGGSSE